MICQLDQIAFQNFGTVLPEEYRFSPRLNSHSIALSTEDVSLYQTNGDTYFRSESGTTLLSVSLDGLRFQDFYLTRPVQLRSGIWFRLTAFGGNSSVLQAAISLPRLIQTQAADTFSIRAKSRLTHIASLIYHEKEPGFVFSGSSSPLAELIYVDHGSLHCVADGKDLLLAQGDLVLYAPNQWHMQYADMDVAPRFVSVSFAPENWDILPLSHRIFKPDRTVVSLLFQMLREQDDLKIHSNEMLLNLLSILLIMLERDPNSPAQKRQTAHDIHHENEIIRGAQQYISANIRQRLSVPIIAKNTGVSTSYLTALFQKHLQISPGEYLRRVKLEEGKQMIREGKMNFTEIAATLQYSTIHHFSRQFKEKFGVTPSEYAKSIR